MQRQQVGKIVRGQQSKFGPSRVTPLSSRPVPLDADALKKVADVIGRSSDAPHKGW